MAVFNPSGRLQRSRRHQKLARERCRATLWPGTYTPVRRSWQLGETTRSVLAGLATRAAAGLTGRRSRLPPQLGHAPSRKRATQPGHHVHSKVQM